MKRSWGSVLSLIMLLAVMALPAAAVDDIVVPVDTIVRSAEGELTELAVVAVAAEQVGAACTVSAQGENNASVHPNNDIIVSSGSDSVVLLDVEGVGGGITSAAGDLVLGDTIVLTLRMGPDGVFSGGLTVTVDCETADTTTTTVPETTTTTVPETTTTTTVPETTTTATTPETTTTTVAATTTTVLDNTTTTQVQQEPTTTTDVAVLGVQIEDSEELPYTGIPTEATMAAALMLIATGFFLKRIATGRQA